MKKIFLSMALATVGYVNSNAQSNLLFVHNSPDPAVATVDIWVESIAGYNKYGEDVTYPQGFFLPIPAAIPGAVTIHIKASNSAASTDPDIFFKTLLSLPLGDNVVVASGLITPTLATAKTNPDAVDNAFDLLISGASLSSSNPSEVAIGLHQGVVDLASSYVHSFITTIQASPRDTLASGFLYNDIENYGTYPAAPRRLHTTLTGSPVTSVVYPANGDVLKTLGGKAAFIVTSGFLDTAGTGTTNTFKVFAYITDAGTAAGAIAAVELPKEKVAGVVQVYHNAADPSVKLVDLYVGEKKQVLGLEFRKGFQSGGFIQDFDYIIDLHKKDSASSVLSTILRFDSDSVVAVIAGVNTPGDFTANPDAENTQLNFFINEPARITQPAGSTQITVFHGATDAPTIDLTVPSLSGLALISDLTYGNFQVASGTSGTSLPTALGTVLVDLKLPDNSVYKSYLVPLAAFDGKAVTAVASGFIDSAANQDGASFKIFVGISSAPFPQIVMLKDTTIITSINDPSVSDMQFRMFPNPTNNDLVMAFDVETKSNVSIDILDITGRVVKNVVNGEFESGKVSLTENIRDLQSGTYITRVVSSNKTSTYKFNVID